MKRLNLHCEIIPSCNQTVSLVFGEGWNSVSVLKLLLALSLGLKLLIEFGPRTKMVFSVLWTAGREKMLPQGEQGAHVSASSVQAIKDHHHQLREQNPAGCGWAGVCLLQLSLLRLRVPWGRFWELQSKGAVSASPWSHCPWVTAWAHCPLLAPPRASAEPKFLPRRHTDASGISTCFCFFYPSVWGSGLPHLFSEVCWELWARSVWPYPPPVFLSSFFPQFVILSISLTLEWYESDVQSKVNEDKAMP